LDKKYKLDFNHAPDLFIPQKIVSARLRSGDAYSIGLLLELDSYFANEFRYKKAGFLDFSPYSIALFLQKTTSKSIKIAASTKLPYFCIKGLQILESFGCEIVWVSATKDGYLSEESLSEANLTGAEFLFCSLVDEDTFLPEDMDTVYKYFDKSQIILDISNGVKKIEIPKCHSAISWGYKLGSYKRSGVYLCDDLSVEFLDSIDLTAYGHLMNAYEAYIYDNNTERKNLMLNILQDSLEEDFSTFIDASKTVANSLYCRFSGILARDFIRTLALDEIYVTNGELCSLGLSKPSSILQEIGFTSDEAREGISLSFESSMSCDDIQYTAKQVSFKYLQLKAIMK
jgi:cysteine desulfurase